MASRRPIRTKEVQNPERILNNLLKDYVDGVLDDYTFLYRASVVKIDQVGGALEKTPPNPRNSIQARVITNSRDKDTADLELPVFWPLFPHDVMPIKEGEHVYVIFEDANEKTHGIWLCRIPEPATTDNANITPGVKKYQNDPVNDFSTIGADQAVQNTDSSPAAVKVSSEFVPETVQKFHARIGDRVIEGSNNTIIVLGVDRPADVASAPTSPGAGTIDVVAGRTKVDDMDLANDKSRIYVTMNSDIDGNFNINVGPSAGPSAAIALKSDQIRIVARNGMKLIVEGGNITVDAQQISLGANAQDPAMLGNQFVQAITPLLTALGGPTVAALGSIPLPAHPALVAAIQTFQNALQSAVLSKKNKVE